MAAKAYLLGLAEGGTVNSNYNLRGRQLAMNVTQRPGGSHKIVANTNLDTVQELLYVYERQIRLPSQGTSEFMSAYDPFMNQLVFIKVRAVTVLADVSVTSPQKMSTFYYLNDFL